jgi:hypothetical protein
MDLNIPVPEMGYDPDNYKCTWGVMAYPPLGFETLGLGKLEAEIMPKLSAFAQRANKVLRTEVSEIRWNSEGLRVIGLKSNGCGGIFLEFGMYQPHNIDTPQEALTLIGMALTYLGELGKCPSLELPGHKNEKVKINIPFIECYTETSPKTAKAKYKARLDTIAEHLGKSLKITKPTVMWDREGVKYISIGSKAILERRDEGYVSREITNATHGAVLFMLGLRYMKIVESYDLVKQLSLRK